ncbi:hypothetical protein EUX98_g3003 [Antrodiella citrinella]|uniref:mRNA stability protein n=1 Tax=Antrodiella citrinella TaxID=2447956 RepID=A0A4V3XIZ9_9APHY|nr:hypothetical protein EUX98_g3003 [Antrodiella citrinella]
MPPFICTASNKELTDAFVLHLQSTHHLDTAGDGDVRVLKSALPAAVDVLHAANITFTLAGVLAGHPVATATLQGSAVMQHAFTYFHKNASALGIAHISQPYVDEDDHKLKFDVTLRRCTDPERWPVHATLTKIDLVYTYKSRVHAKDAPPNDNPFTPQALLPLMSVLDRLLEKFIVHHLVNQVVLSLPEDVYGIEGDFHNIAKASEQPAPCRILLDEEDTEQLLVADLSTDVQLEDEDNFEGPILGTGSQGLCVSDEDDELGADTLEDWYCVDEDDEMDYTLHDQDDVEESGDFSGLSLYEDDSTKLSEEEQKLFRLYGKLPTHKNVLTKMQKDRKYFDSGDYALSKAGKAPQNTVGTAIPNPENIPHATSSPVNGHSMSVSPTNVTSPVKESPLAEPDTDQSTSETVDDEVDAEEEEQEEEE